MRTTIPNDRWILLPMIVFRYVPVHNAMELLRWDSKTNNKMTAANQYLEQSTPPHQFATDPALFAASQLFWAQQWVPQDKSRCSASIPTSANYTINTI